MKSIPWMKDRVKLQYSEEFYSVANLVRPPSNKLLSRRAFLIAAYLTLTTSYP